MRLRLTAAVLVLSGIFAASVASAQEALEWTWMGGSSINGNIGDYGVLGTAAAGNTPGARDGASSWTDSSGDFWLFVVHGVDANGDPGNLNDLWVYQLSSTALPPVTSLSATSLSFGSVAVGGASASQQVTLTNTGGSSLSITSITVTGVNASSFDFAKTCESILAPGAICGIHGHFAPTTSGAMSATVTITDNAGGSPQSISLTGMGVLETTVSLSSTGLSFGSVGLGGSSASQSVTLSNTGNSSLSTTGITLTGTGASSFVLVKNCGTGLAAGASCTIQGHFAPKTTSAFTATITINDNATGSPRTIALSGTGIILPTTVSLSATSLAFGTVRVGSASGSQSATLTNTGLEVPYINSITVAGPNASSFVFANSCGSSLTAGNSCTIHGHFGPTATGPLVATITITDSATGSP